MSEVLLSKSELLSFSEGKFRGFIKSLNTDEVRVYLDTIAELVISNEYMSMQPNYNCNIGWTHPVLGTVAINKDTKKLLFFVNSCISVCRSRGLRSTDLWGDNLGSFNIGSSLAETIEISTNLEKVFKQEVKSLIKSGACNVLVIDSIKGVFYTTNQGAVAFKQLKLVKENMRTLCNKELSDFQVSLFGKSESELRGIHDNLISQIKSLKYSNVASADFPYGVKRVSDGTVENRFYPMSYKLLSDKCKLIRKDLSKCKKLTKETPSSISNTEQNGVANVDFYFSLDKKLNKQELEDLANYLKGRSVHYLFERLLYFSNIMLSPNSISCTKTDVCIRPWQSKYLGLVYISNTYSRCGIIVHEILKQLKERHITSIDIMQRLKSVDTSILPSDINSLSSMLKEQEGYFTSAVKSCSRSGIYSNLLIINSSNLFYVDDTAYRSYILSCAIRKSIGDIKYSSTSNVKNDRLGATSYNTIKFNIEGKVPDKFIFTLGKKNNYKDGNSKVEQYILTEYCSFIVSSPNSSSELKRVCAVLLESVGSELNLSNSTSISFSRLTRHFLYTRDKYIASVCHDEGVRSLGTHKLESEYYTNKASKIMQDYKKEVLQC